MSIGLLLIFIGGVLLIVGSFIQGRVRARARQREEKRTSKGNPIKPYQPTLKDRAKAGWQYGWNAGMAAAANRRERRDLKRASKNK